MTSGELARQVWKAGAKIVATRGKQIVVMRRMLPKELDIECRSCGAVWSVVLRKGRCPPGYRKCPDGCEREPAPLILNI